MLVRPDVFEVLDFDLIVAVCPLLQLMHSPEGHFEAIALMEQARDLGANGGSGAVSKR